MDDVEAERSEVPRLKGSGIEAEAERSEVPRLKGSGIEVEVEVDWVMSDG